MLAGTTAPVIALTVIISVGQALDIGFRWSDEERELYAEEPPNTVETRDAWTRLNSYKYSPRVKALTALAAHALNLIVQVVVLGVSLVSLAYGTDAFPPVVVVVLLMVTMGLLIYGQFNAYISGRLAQTARKRFKFFKTLPFGPPPSDP